MISVTAGLFPAFSTSMNWAKLTGVVTDDEGVVGAEDVVLGIVRTGLDNDAASRRIGHMHHRRGGAVSCG